MAEEMRKAAKEMGLRDSEYDLIVKTLGREPTFTEVGMYAVMWSEHCGYKYSRPLLELLPTEGPHVIQGPGENAGVADLGEGWAAAFKIESHNHPSAIEPYQGAATGIGGIIRDILSMGARPIALLDSLHFGEIEDEHSRYLFDGVVAGIAGYGNCLAGEEMLFLGNSVRGLPIGEFCEAVLEGRIKGSFEVLSFDPSTGEPCWRRIRRVFKVRSQEMLEIETSMGKRLKVTPDHPVVVWERGGLRTKPAVMVRKGDMLPILKGVAEGKEALKLKGDLLQGPSGFKWPGRLALVTVEEVKKVEGDLEAYDIEVEGTHLFVTTGGIVTHNCVGIPTVAGEVYFEPSYADNPLVNVMCVGILKRDELMLARAAGEGNSVIIVGSLTGRDGIHGVTFASEELTEKSEERRPSVQVGDPFSKKSLIEATLEALKTGYVVGLQDMGGAGITCSTCETAAKAGTGIELELTKVPLREERMTPYEIMLSESQERMLLVVKRGHEKEIRRIFRKWGLIAEIVGYVTSDGMLRVKQNGKVAAEVPAKSLADEAPTYTNKKVVPEHIKKVSKFDFSSLPVPQSMEEAALNVLSSPTVASKRWVYDQYDHMVLINTVLLPGLGAGVLRVKGTKKAIAVTTDCNGRYCYLDPKEGAKAAVAEAARNLACVGAEPLGMTDCLNFGNPEDPEVYWAFCEAVEGMAEACRALGIPVVSGNVSFYNESPREAVYPTPVVGMVGLIPDLTKCGKGAAFPQGTRVALLGLTKAEVGASEYLKRVHGIIEGLPPRVELDLERRVQKVAREALRSGLAVGGHDLSEGGLLAALSEVCLLSGRGLEVDLTEHAQASKIGRVDVLLFSETQGRILLSVPPEEAEEVEELARSEGVFLFWLGEMKGKGLKIGLKGDNILSLSKEALSEAYEGTIPRWMER